MQAFFIMLFNYLLIIVLAIGHSDAFTRNDFPEDFLFGAATSAYQVWLCLYVFFLFVLLLFSDVEMFEYSGKERLMKTEGLQAFGTLSPTLVSWWRSYVVLCFKWRSRVIILGFSYLKSLFYYTIDLDLQKFAANLGNGDIACDGYHKYKVLSLSLSLSLYLFALARNF